MARSRPSAPPALARRLTGRALMLAPWVGFAAMTALWAQASRRRVPGLSKQEVADPDYFERQEPGRGRTAAYPHRIPATGWGDIAWRVYREIGKDRLPVVAGGVTFFTLLASVPAVGVFVSLYGLFADVSVVNSQLNQLAAFVPPQVLGVIGEQMTRFATERNANLSVAFVVSLGLSLWTASLGMRVVIGALNVAYEETEKRNIFLRFFLTYVLTFAALVFLAVVTALMVAAPLVLQWLGIGGLVIPLRWLLLFVIVAGAFATLYRFGPSRRQARWRWVVWGALFAAVVWIGGSLGYSWYVNNVARFQATYGSLGALVGFLFWIWFSIMALLIGAELNAEVEHQTAIDSTVGAPKPMGDRGAIVADSVGLSFVGLRKGAGTIWGAVRRRVARLVHPQAGRDPG